LEITVWQRKETMVAPQILSSVQYFLLIKRGLFHCIRPTSTTLRCLKVSMIVLNLATSLQLFHWFWTYRFHFLIWAAYILFSHRLIISEQCTKSLSRI
jgi:hypothetical protein